MQARPNAQRKTNGMIAATNFSSFGKVLNLVIMVVYPVVDAMVIAMKIAMVK
jgi:hypothetical protein